MTDGRRASIAEIVRALQALPMHLYDELAPRSSTAPPTKHGFYAWWQIPGALPGVPGTTHPTAEFELLYVGIAPGDTFSNSNLRKRLAKTPSGGHWELHVPARPDRLPLGNAAGSPAGPTVRS